MTITREKILLVDDHAVVRAGFRHLLETNSNYVVSEASTAEEAYILYDKLSPDVVVLDISMPGMGGIEGLRRLLNKHANARILLLSMYDDPAYVSRAMKIGARGYISKNSAAESLTYAIGAVMAGKLYFSPDIDQQMLDQEKDYASETLGLSAREFEVFRHLAEGRSTAEIAHSLNLSPKTVSNHRSHLMNRLKLGSTAELVRFAIRQQIIKA
jgi:two-component system invasion response regulator UvrY